MSSRGGIVAGAMMMAVAASAPMTDLLAAARDPVETAPAIRTLIDCPGSAGAVSASYRITRERIDPSLAGTAKENGSDGSIGAGAHGDAKAMAGADARSSADVDAKAGSVPDVSRYQLVRDERRVLHVYPDRGIAEYFALTPNERLRSVRYFDGPRRAVAFDPVDLTLSGERRGWADVSTLSDEQHLRSELETTGSTGKGCERRTILQNAGGDPGKTEVHWMQALSLPAYARSESGGSSTTWELESWSSDPVTVARAFSEREGYRETDFADIGDSESDPFFMRMIDLGFIPHAASGFYDTDGRPVGGRGDAHARGEQHLH